MQSSATPQTPQTQEMQQPPAEASIPLPHPPIAPPDLILMGEFCEQRGPTPLRIFEASEGNYVNGVVVNGEKEERHFSSNEVFSEEAMRRCRHFQYPPHQNLEENQQESQQQQQQKPSATRSTKSQNPHELSFWKPLVTRILSSDHATSDHFPYASLPSHFYLTHDEYDVFCMLLTFRDLYARGFARPVCLCYISHQSNAKILPHFQRFTVTFENLARILQFGNYHCFLKDLLKEIPERNLSHIIDDSTKQEILDDLTDVKQRYDSFLNHSHSLLESHIANIIKAMILHQDWTRTELPSDFYNLLQRGLQVAPEYLTDIMPNIMDQMHKRKGFERELRRISQIAHATYPNVCSLITDCILKFFSRSSRVLLLETDDLELIEEKALPSLLFVGKNLVMDFDLDMCQAKRKLRPHLLSAPPPPPTATTMRTNSAGALSSVTSFTTANSLPMNGSSWNSSIHEPHSSSASSNTGSVLMDMATVDDASEASGDSLTEDYPQPAHMTRNTDHNNSTLLLYNNNHLSSPSSRGSSGRFAAPPPPAAGSPSTMVAPSFYPHLVYPEYRYSIFQGDYTGSYTSLVFPSVPWHSNPNHNTQSAGEFLQGSPTTLDEQTLTAPYNLRLFFDHPSSLHLVYSILTGRLVVITAPREEKGRVRQLIDILSNYLPGQHWTKSVDKTEQQSTEDSIDSPYIRAWSNYNVTLRDVQRYKIIGLCKPAVVPRQLRNNVTILDLERGFLRAPPYDGFFLQPLFQMGKWFEDDATCSAHSHAVLLEIAKQAVVEMHAFTLPAVAPHAPPTLRDLGNSSSVGGPAGYPSLTEKYALKKHFATLTPCDCRIINHFIDVITMQQTDRMMGNMMPTPVKLRNESVMDFEL